MQRYKSPHMMPHDDGEYVLHSDHEAALKEVAARPFPRHYSDSHDDWIIKPEFLKRVAKEIDDELVDVPHMETIEAVLLALEKVEGK